MMVKAMFSKAKYAFICLAAISISILQAEQTKFFSAKNYAELENVTRNKNSCDKLCIGKVLARCIKAKNLKAEFIDVDAIRAQSFCGQHINAESICAQTVNITEQLCVPSLNSPRVCAEELNANNVCINGILKANGFEQCSKYRATAVFSADTPYVLGNIVDYDIITDDPNNNVALFPFTYTVPVSGYYILTTQVDQHGLQGADPIIGTPIANLEVLVNGATFRETFTPYLSFHNGQKITVSTLISVIAGDLISVRYHIYIMADGVGFAPYVGSAVIEGNGSEDNATMFKIHYLSSDCTELPCTPCVAPCMPVPCDLPCTSVQDCCSNMSCCDDL